MYPVPTNSPLPEPGRVDPTNPSAVERDKGIPTNRNDYADNMPPLSHVSDDLGKKPTDLKNVGNFFKKLGLGLGATVGAVGMMATSPLMLLGMGVGALIGSQIKNDKSQSKNMEEGSGWGAVIGSLGFVVLLVASSDILRGKPTESKGD